VSCIIIVDYNITEDSPGVLCPSHPYTEAEHQTGKRLKQVQLDMGREWYNSAWDNYWTEQGLDFEFTTPYAH